MSTNREFHHYVKNLLQTILSYINTSSINDKITPNETLKKITSFIYILSNVQDRVFEEQPLDFKRKIRADQVINKAIELLSDNFEIVTNEFPEFSLPVKRAVNLSLIFLELLNCLKKYCSQPIYIEISELEGGRYLFSAEGAVSTGKNLLKQGDLNTELKLASLLIKSDLKTQLKFDIGQNLKISTETAFACE